MPALGSSNKNADQYIGKHGGQKSSEGHHHRFHAVEAHELLNVGVQTDGRHGHGSDLEATGIRA